jgi:prefoldin alpha subunit
VDLGALSVQQLSSVKKQLDEELEHLTTSFTKLRAAQTKFRECNRALETGLSPASEGMSSVEDGNVVRPDKGTGKQILVPLTSSLYVPGYLSDLERAIVDVGTGFYVEKVYPTRRASIQKLTNDSLRVQRPLSTMTASKI